MNRCENCQKCRREVRNRNITVRLLFHSLIAAMLIFAALRLCGFTYFVQQYVEMTLPDSLSSAILFVYFVIEGTLILKILTDEKTGYCVLWAVGYKLVLYCVPSENLPIVFALDLLYILLIPLCYHKSKRISIKKSIMLILALSAYQLFMMVGRYNLIFVGKQDVIWQILSTIDYKMFLVTIYLGKELCLMDTGCFLFWGKFDKLAKRIGRAILKPFTHE